MKEEKLKKKTYKYLDKGKYKNWFESKKRKK